MRDIRGAIGMGVIWAAVLSVAGFVPRWVLGFNTDLPFPILFGGLGFIAGVMFSGLLVITERRRRFEEMTLPRFAAWGAAAGLLLSVLFVRGASLDWRQMLAISATFVVTSAACAAGSLAVARRSAKREPVDGSNAEQARIDS